LRCVRPRVSRIRRMSGPDHALYCMAMMIVRRGVYVKIGAFRAGGVTSFGAEFRRSVPISPRLPGSPVAWISGRREGHLHFPTPECCVKRIV
jgi:hypothetical protein